MKFELTQSTKIKSALEKNNRVTDYSDSDETQKEYKSVILTQIICHFNKNHLQYNNGSKKPWWAYGLHVW